MTPSTLAPVSSLLPSLSPPLNPILPGLTSFPSSTLMSTYSDPSPSLTPLRIPPVVLLPFVRLYPPLFGRPSLPSASPVASSRLSYPPRLLLAPAGLAHPTVLQNSKFIPISFIHANFKLANLPHYLPFDPPSSPLPRHTASDPPACFLLPITTVALCHPPLFYLCFSPVCTCCCPLLLLCFCCPLPPSVTCRSLSPADSLLFFFSFPEGTLTSAFRVPFIPAILHSLSPLPSLSATPLMSGTT